LPAKLFDVLLAAAVPAAVVNTLDRSLTGPLHSAPPHCACDERSGWRAGARRRESGAFRGRAGARLSQPPLPGEDDRSL